MDYAFHGGFLNSWQAGITLVGKNNMVFFLHMKKCLYLKWRLKRTPLFQSWTYQEWPTITNPGKSITLCVRNFRRFAERQVGAADSAGDIYFVMGFIAQNEDESAYGCTVLVYPLSTKQAAWDVKCLIVHTHTHLRHHTRYCRHDTGRLCHYIR